METVNYDLTHYQAEFLTSQRRYPALVAGIGTGKTMTAIFKMLDLMEKYPGNLGLVVRKEFTDLKDSTIKDFEHYTGRAVGTDKDVKVGDGSRIMFRHGDEINVLKNINLGAIYIEQAEEFESDETFTFLRDRLRRKEAGLRQLFIIANTNGHNWIYDNWKLNKVQDPDFHLVEASTFDNEKNLPADFIADLRKMKATHPHHYNRYVLNSWEDVDVQDQILQYEWIRDAVKRKPSGGDKSVIICDPARYGDDETVIYAIQGGGILDKLIYRNKSTMETAGSMIQMFNKHSSWGMGVDVVGLGAGIADRIRELGYEIEEINSSAESSDKKRYKNLRAEIWASAATKFFNGHASLPNDNALIEQLSAVKYKAIESNGRLQVESKEGLKKRIGCSPDRADCYVMGLWLSDRITAPTRDSEYAGTGTAEHHTRRRGY